MKVHGLLLQRHSDKAVERRHDGRVAVDTRNTSWCSDGLEIGCDNGAKVRVVFSLDCCDREAMGFVATTAGISAEDVRDLMTATVEHCFGRVNRLPATIEWLTDNGSRYTAKETRLLAREINLVPVTAARLGNRPAMLKCKAPPADRARDADIKMGCSRSATHATVNRRDDPVPKVL